MGKETMEAEYDTVISTYYGDEQVLAIILMKLDTKMADRIAQEIADFDCVEDVFLVTGDTDLIIKARFSSYKDLKGFVVGSMGKLEGVKDTKTLMVVTAYKEKGMKKEN